MSIELSGLDPRNERRLRIVFTDTLASGAYGAPAPSYYVIENQDGLGGDPGVNAALIVAGNPNVVELALGSDLVAGALYQISVIGVPAISGPAATSASTTLFRFGVPTTVVDAETKASDADVLLFARDLVFSGIDYIETPEGDLAFIEGAPNALAALTRRCLGSPLAWDATYSARAYDSVDGPLAGAAPLKARLQSQCLTDKRCRSVQVEIVEADDQSSSVFRVTPVLVSGASPQAISVPITVQS